MHAAWIWGTALAVYGCFRLWYDGVRGPLAPSEIDAHLARLAASPELDPERLATMRAFLEADDGREFFMLNLIRLHDGPVASPDAGAPAPAREVLARYTRRFLPGVFARGGHPAFAGRAAGGAVERWGTPPDPGWRFAGVIRYRSRRDMIELVTSPSFAPAHAFKIAAMASTLAFPVAPGFVVFGPRLWVALALALVAALAQLVLRAPSGAGA